LDAVAVQAVDGSAPDASKVSSAIATGRSPASSAENRSVSAVGACPFTAAAIAAKKAGSTSVSSARYFAEPGLALSHCTLARAMAATYGGSQASPAPSRSESAWSALATLGQLSASSFTPSLSLSKSHASPMSSPSMSAWSGLAISGQLSSASGVESPSGLRCNASTAPPVSGPQVDSRRLHESSEMVTTRAR